MFITLQQSHYIRFAFQLEVSCLLILIAEIFMFNNKKSLNGSVMWQREFNKCFSIILRNVFVCVLGRKEIVSKFSNWNYVYARAPKSNDRNGQKNHRKKGTTPSDIGRSDKLYIMHVEMDKVFENRKTLGIEMKMYGNLHKRKTFHLNDGLKRGNILLVFFFVDKWLSYAAFLCYHHSHLVTGMSIVKMIISFFSLSLAQYYYGRNKTKLSETRFSPWSASGNENIFFAIGKHRKWTFLCINIKWLRKKQFTVVKTFLHSVLRALKIFGKNRKKKQNALREKKQNCWKLFAINILTLF